MGKKYFVLCYQVASLSHISVTDVSFGATIGRFLWEDGIKIFLFICYAHVSFPFLSLFS
jgi:hypothetical protein